MTDGQKGERVGRWASVWASERVSGQAGSSIEMMVLHHPIDLDLDLDLDLGLDLDLNLDLDFRLDDYWPNDIQLYDSTSSQ